MGKRCTQFISAQGQVRLIATVDGYFYFRLMSHRDDDDLGNIKAVKLKVTVISWTVNDRFVVTAGNDAFVRVWDAGNYDLLHLLKVRVRGKPV